MQKTGYKEIFIFIAGSTPQVITETIYALAMKNPPVYPDEVFIITTKMGKERVEDALIKKGILKQLAEEYRLPEIAITNNSFILPVDLSGRPLEDIRNESDNESMGNLITSFIKHKTDDPSSRLHCSIAGGRKTMSFYLGSALQLFGRPCDKLYHVLVTPEFENHPDFYYKPKKDRILTPSTPFFVREGEINTKDAEIALTELPFIRLRSKLSLSKKGFKELVAEGQREIDIAISQPEIRVKLSEKTISIGSQTIKLAPVPLMIYTAYLKQKLYHCKHPSREYCSACSDCFPSLLELTTRPALEEMAKDYMLMHPSRVDDMLHKYKSGLSHEIIRQAISKIKKEISRQLGDEILSSYYSITTSLRGYSNTKHGVRAEKGKIRIE